MRHAAGTWLEGPASIPGDARSGNLSLPADGPGSLAKPGARLLAFVIDGIVANLLAGLPYLFGVQYGPGDRGYAVYAAFLLQEFVLVSVVGATIGKQMLGIRVTRLDGGRLTWPWVLARTVLLSFLVPAVMWDRDGRGLHDRASGALTIRAGRPVARGSGSASSSAGAPGAPGASGALRAAGAPMASAAPARPAAGASPTRTGATAKPPVRRRKKRR